MKTTKEKIGFAAVDSGQLLVCDPCYIDGQWEKEEFSDKPPQNNFSYNSCCKKTLSKEGAGQLNFKLGHEGCGVVFSSGYGDGCYPVYAEKNKEGRIIRVTIEMG